MAEAFRQVRVTRIREGRRTSDHQDAAATEEPLEVRLHGRPFAVIMRTPGADRELAAGFLFSEGILAGVDDLNRIESRGGASGCPGGVVDVMLAGRASSTLSRLLSVRRRVVTNASCGMCGRLTLEAVRAVTPRVEAPLTMAAAALAALPDRLRQSQCVFDATGGLHAAGLFTADGLLQDGAEDVGRHNAVDKVIGRRFMRGALPLSDAVLCVSGRASFEIVQKASQAGVPIVAAVSAPSTFAIELAQETGITLAGFVRSAGFNIYTHPFRVR